MVEVRPVAPLTVPDLEGRVAVLTGAGSEIGIATAHALARCGARVVLGDLDERRLTSAHAALFDVGDRIRAMQVDVCEPEQVDALVARAVEEWGGLDLMFNFAGIIADARVTDTTRETLDRVLDVNLKGVFFGCQAAVRAMEARGSIVNMTSQAAFGPFATLSVYSMSKAGVAALTRALASEVAEAGIRVNAIAPGFIEGGMTARHVRDDEGGIDDARYGEVLEKARERNPSRMTGTGDDIAQLALFLASDASRYVTGQVLHANGGAYMP